MNQIESIAQLATLSLERLTQIMGGSGTAEQLFTFIYTDGNASTASDVTTASKQVVTTVGGRTVRPRHKRLPLKKPSGGKNV